MEQQKTALITGASSGIGAAFAEVFASEGYRLVLTARREARLHAVAERLAREHGVQVDVVPADLTQRGAATHLYAELQRRQLVIDALVNSAGFGAPGKYTDAEWHVHEDMLQVMAVGTSELTYRVLPGMVERGHGRIINVASIAGLAPAGAGTMYGAAKTFVVSFSVSLAREVARHGVSVTAVCPGLTRTEFHQAPGMHDTVKGVPGWMWMAPLTVARQGFAAAAAGKGVIVNGVANRVLVTMLRCLAHPVVFAIAKRCVGALRRVRARSEVA